MLELIARLRVGKSWSTGWPTGGSCDPDAGIVSRKSAGQRHFAELKRRLLHTVEAMRQTERDARGLARH
jgi:hypothetical protein